MSVHPFLGFNPKPSHYGYNWTTEEVVTSPRKPDTTSQRVPSPTSPLMADAQLANMPAALLSTLKREKKPFTYTPGGVDLSEVLDARLKKRIERKQKYNENKMLVVMPTHNTPLDLYSTENALQALELQAELVASDKNLGANLPAPRFEPGNDLNPRGTAQSKAFRMLQIITDTEEEAVREKPQHQYHDEMRFTGIRDSGAIPSRFFQTLQKITGTDKEEEEEEEHRTEMIRPMQHPVKTAAPAPKPAFVQPKVDSNQPFHLKRPAAFLPNPNHGFRHHPSAGTDF